MTDEDQKLGPPPVEPMSDVTWARVERGLWSRIDSGATDAPPVASRRRWLWLAVPALAVAAVVALLLGTGVLSSRDATPLISSGDSIEPSRVVTGAAPSAVSFGDAHIDLAAQSAIVMTREGGSPSVLLERGVATFAVAPRRERAPFVVRAGDTVVRVVGTKFSVARSDERISVAVEHGLVDVQFRGATQRVGAGQTWSSEAPDKVAIQMPDTAGANGAASDSADNRTATPDNRTATPDNRTATPDNRTATPDNRTATPDTGATVGSAAPTAGSGARAGSTAPTGGSGARVGSAAPTAGSGARTGSAAPTAGSASPVTDTDGAKFDRLTALERRDSKAALAGYLELSRGNTKWSAVALFAAGRLAADLHDHRAATFLDIYLRRFPNGANAEDARNLLTRLKGATP